MSDDYESVIRPVTHLFNQRPEDEMSDHPDYCAGHNDGYEQAMEETKAEIDRLRSMVRVQEAALNRQHEERDRLRAENERLREALRYNRRITLPD